MEDQAPGWMIDGYFAWVSFWIWIVLILVFGLWRSFSSPDPDPIRPSGPIDT